MKSNISSSSPESHKQESECDGDKIILTAKDIVLKPFVVNS